MRTVMFAVCLSFLLTGCAKKAEEATQVPAGKETVTTTGPAKAAGGGGTKGITEDQIELGPGLQNADSRAGGKLGGN